MITKFELSNKTKINDIAFEGLSCLKDIFVSADNPRYRSIDGNLYTKDGKTLIKYMSAKPQRSFVIPDGVEVVESGAIKGAKFLTEITISKTVKRLSPCAFSGCVALKKVNYLGSINEWVDIDMGCTQSDLVNNPLEYAENLYINGELVENVVISNVKRIKMNAFSGCKSIKNVKIQEGVEYIEHQAFCGCSSLTKVEIPTSVKIGTDCFLDCDKIEIIKK